MLGEYLVRKGLLTKTQLQLALRRQKELRSFGEDYRIGELLVQMGFISEAELRKALGRQPVEQPRAS